VIVLNITEDNVLMVNPFIFVFRT